MLPICMYEHPFVPFLPPFFPHQKSKTPIFPLIKIPQAPSKSTNISSINFSVNKKIPQLHANLMQTKSFNSQHNTCNSSCNKHTHIHGSYTWFSSSLLATSPEHHPSSISSNLFIIFSLPSPPLPPSKITYLKRNLGKSIIDKNIRKYFFS
eukprot:Phypoly_transcript_17740.p1 GENE.Phypoly_transcript_17740~~Phypoly_transcript_17740.p1  ORF type:complete len:151 (-),score=9.37 Phypoly_transcript_17740:28-480(-)